ncbi:hypothetical protein N7520_008862 [Penicillium odoratum]|uniref:uncharacterized protein n=1 Tax=Penicillium odoratum TaxID=1167516 RepID=UPI00254679A8|nr:uncharacterized protein N7520_008862 [Penicillium odoratum]KAJ5751945.1 hypothetical protein N7520_008862 [Penicillium odoratum]
MLSFALISEFPYRYRFSSGSSPLIPVVSPGTGSIRHADGPRPYCLFVSSQQLFYILNAFTNKSKNLVPTHGSQVIGTPMVLPTTSYDVIRMQPNQLAAHILTLPYRVIRNRGRMPIVNIEAIFVEVERAKPSTTTPTSQLAILGGSYPITLAFKKGRVMSLRSRIPIKLKRNVRDKHISVTLMLDGRHKVVEKEFSEIIRKISGHLSITPVDAYETDASVLILAKVNLDVWARFSHHFDFDFVGVIVEETRR